MTRTFDLFASLRKVGGKRTTRGKFTLEIRAPQLVLQVDERAIAQTAAQAITEVIKTNLLGGKTPDGEPLPAVAAATRERRRHRANQAARGGAPHPKYAPKAFPRAQANHTKRFKAPKLGEFDPSTHGQRGLVGLESGLLASSVVAAPDPPGWRVFFANPRALVDKAGTSPVERVFRRLGKVWSQAGMRNPKIQAAMRQVAKAIVDHRQRKLFNELLKFGRSVSGLAEQVGQLGQ